MLFLLNWDWFDLIRAIYSSVSCPNFCCHSCTTLNKVAWIRVGKISKHEVYNMKELRKSKKWHKTLKCPNQFKKTQNQLKQIESWSGYFFLPTKPCLAPSEPSGIMLIYILPWFFSLSIFLWRHKKRKKNRTKNANAWK